MEVFDRTLGRLARVTTSGRFIPEIDGLRFIAIALVVLFHLRSYSLWIRPANTYAINADNDWVARLTMHGYYGVQFFFAISGFILALPFASHFLKQRKPVKLGQYFLRRVTRLEPPYIVCMVGIFIWLVVFAASWSTAFSTMPGATLAERARGLLPSLLASLIYQHNLIFGRESLVNVVAWSLEVEIQFYILTPLLVQVFRIPGKMLRRGLIIAVCLGLVFLQGIFVTRFPVLHLTILGNLQFFLLGYLLADVYLLDWNERPRTTRYWDLVAAAGWVTLYAVWELKFYEAYFLPALIFVIYTAAFRGVIANRIFTWRWLTTIGGMCYSIYLTHSFLLGRLAHYTDGWMLTDYFFVHFIMRAVLVIPLLLLFATVFFVLIEKPCMQRDWPQQLGRKIRSWFVTPVVQPANE